MKNQLPGEMKAQPPLVSVVVLSHARPRFLGEVLASIVAQSHPNVEIIVVDNKSSSSHEIAQVVSRYEGVRLIQNSSNLGFTGGMNRGIEAATGDYIHCTLDDVVLDPDCLLRLAEYAEGHADVGLLSGVLSNEDGETIRCAGGEYDLSPVYQLRIKGVGAKCAELSTEPYAVGYIPGGMIFSRLDFLRELNGFREDFFMYMEDIDLCARTLRAGRSIVVVPRAKARILDAPHAFKPEGIAFHKIKNFFSVYLLHARLRVLPEFYLRYGVMNLLRSLFSQPKMVWPMVRAWAWFVPKAPALVLERLNRAKHDRVAQCALAPDEKLESASTTTTVS